MGRVNGRMRAGILGVGSCVPERVLTNFDLEKMVDTSDEWISTRTGIKERRIADESKATSDYAAGAARRALERAGVDALELDLVIVATVTPDMFFPSTACLVQEMIGATRAAAFDLSAGCSGFVYALDVAARGIEAGAYRNVLVVGADLLSRVTDYTDRSTCVLFGDGAGAVVLGAVDEGGILSTYLGADGSGGEKLCIPAGGSRLPAAKATDRGQHFIHMEGNEVFKFAVRIMPEAAQEAMRRAGVAPADVDLFIPHQANVRIIDAAAKRLGIESERVFVNVDRYGNTSAASIPIALDEAVGSGRVKAGDILVLVGFGAGLTWGAAALQWNGERVPRG